MSAFPVLLVEDNLDHAMLIEDMLSDGDASVEVVHVTDGTAALNHLSLLRSKDAALPKLILLDINLPGLSGHSVLDRLKEDATLRAIPTVMLSTSRAEEDLLRCVAANSFVVKSPDFDQWHGHLTLLRDYWSRVHVRPKSRGGVLQ